MATYTIRTTRSQEIGLKFAYDNYADKTVYTTQEAYFQFRINTQVTDPMFTEQQRAQSISFDQSFATVPETQQPAARTEIEGVITTHGGTIVPPGPIKPPPIPANFTGGTLPTSRGTVSNPIQIGGGVKKDVQASGGDGGGDNETEKT